MLKGKVANGFAAILLTFAGASHAGLEEALGGAMKALGDSPQAQQALMGAAGDNETVAALKEALAQGVETAINTLGQTDGFLGDELVRITAPDSVKLAEDTARKLGQGEYVDNFVESMNRAAEQAVPEASKILGDAIRKMSVEDAVGIVNGADDAATQYFRKVAEAPLTERFLPIVKEATSANNVTSAYKTLVDQGGDVVSGLAGSLGGGSIPGLGGINKESLDLDRYVTTGALDGLFTYIAKEEKRIRENPLARSTDLLKKVFGK